MGNFFNSGSLIPNRKADALTGSDFINKHLKSSVAVREADSLNQYLSGNIPESLRKFKPISINSGSNSIIYLVMVDYLQIGSNINNVYMPTNPLTAQAVANKFDCTLPTKKMVDDIYQSATIKLPARPQGAPYDTTMSNTPRIQRHDYTIKEQLSSLGYDSNSNLLIAGHKKDIVLSNKLYPKNSSKRVAIYGWFQSSGIPIQGPTVNAKHHDDLYLDYSHGVRLISNDVMVNGKLTRMQDVFSDPQLSKLLSDEGPLKFQKY